VTDALEVHLFPTCDIMTTLIDVGQSAWAYIEYQIRDAGPRPLGWDVTVPVEICPSRHICYVSYFLGSVVVNKILLLPTRYLAKFGRTRPDGMNTILR